MHAGAERPLDREQHRADRALPQAGGEVDLATEGGVMVNDANVTAADVQASNGVIHVIDQVLIPPDVDVSSL